MYYVKVVTRGATAVTAKGSPRQALAYITDGHDSRRDPGYSDAELVYVARMGEGWKTDLEGGRVPLVGFGLLRDELDEAKMAATFEDACLPRHDRRATTGYKSMTFTVPKEVSLFAEGHREKARAAINAAVGSALDRIYGDKDYVAVAAIHTRNESGEIHYHAHVLVGKFAFDRASGKVRSLNSAAGGNTGHRQLSELKAAWKEGIDREFKERLGIHIEQRGPNAPPALIMPDGTRLDALNRAGRRQLEKDIAPWYGASDKGAGAARRQLRLGVMDDRIFEIATARGDAAAWDPSAFRELFPDQARFVGRHEKRIGTLRAIGYLTAEGRPTPKFRLHFAVRHGIDTPELQQLRLSLAGRAARSGGSGPGSRAPTDPWESIGKLDAVRRRIERLGISQDDLRQIFRDAEARKPTPERLRLIRIEAARQALWQPPTQLPRTKTVIRAYVGVQKAKVERLYLIVAGAATFQYGAHKKIADQLRRATERDLLLAKDRRLARVALGLRPIFSAVRVAMPHQARRLEQAVQRCARLAYSQEMRRLEREGIARAYADWRAAFIDRPMAAMQRAAERMERPAQARGRGAVEIHRDRMALGDLEGARAMYQAGAAALKTLRRPEAAVLARWVGREDELVRAVFATAKAGPGEAAGLGKEEYQAAVRAGQIGRLLGRERDALALEGPAGDHPESAELRLLARRLHAFDIKSPVAGRELNALAPSELADSLSAFRQAGLLSDGPGWTVKAGQARALARGFGRTVEQALDADSILTDALLRRRQAP